MPKTPTVESIGAVEASRSQQPVVPHGAMRSLPDLTEHKWTSQSSTGNVPEILLLFSRNLRRRGSVARRAGRRGRGGKSQVRQLRELADLGRDRAVDLVVVEVPATPRSGRAPRRASGGAGGTRRKSSFLSWPISVGIGPVIWFSWRRLRRRGAVARRAGRRGRGGNSQLGQRRELADLGRERAGDLVVVEVPATPRGGRAARRASGTRGELAAAPAS